VFGRGFYLTVLRSEKAGAEIPDPVRGRFPQKFSYRNFTDEQQWKLTTFLGLEKYYSGIHIMALEVILGLAKRDLPRYDSSHSAIWATSRAAMSAIIFPFSH